MDERDDERELRRRRREFIRTHHPDAGGDPERFIAGLDDTDVPGPGPAPRVVGVSTTRWRRHGVAAARRLLGRRPPPPRVR